ncbi:hypothetical protein B484DRAFT_457840 [Ochromonadaceae sp. CCMP2298]|nr:hypothetical protein B484DRAFT_457840 [Ochromonadaceae sp. CCMP2298]
MRIIVTGFGAFGGVEDNPSKQIIAELESSFTCSAELVFRTLEVSVACCENFHAEMQAQMSQECIRAQQLAREKQGQQTQTQEAQTQKEQAQEHASEEIIFVHIGVDGGSACIKLERLPIKPSLSMLLIPTKPLLSMLLILLNPYYLCYTY